MGIEEGMSAEVQKVTRSIVGGILGESRPKLETAIKEDRFNGPKGEYGFFLDGLKADFSSKVIVLQTAIQNSDAYTGSSFDMGSFMNNITDFATEETQDWEAAKLAGGIASRIDSTLIPLSHKYADELDIGFRREVAAEVLAIVTTLSGSEAVKSVSGDEAKLVNGLVVGKTEDLDGLAMGISSPEKIGQAIGHAWAAQEMLNSLGEKVLLRLGRNVKLTDIDGRGDELYDLRLALNLPDHTRKGLNENAVDLKRSFQTPTIGSILVKDLLKVSTAA